MGSRWAAIVLSILGSAGMPAAEAALPPYVYEQAREQAAYHVQIKVTRVTPPPKTPGECETTGDVARVFRDRSGELRLGTRLAFAVSCSRRSEPPLVGGTLWTDLDTLRAAKYLEVFLNRTDGRYQVALWQSRIIDAPTDKPVFAQAPAAAPRPTSGADPYDEGMRLYNAKQDRASIPYFDRVIAANPARAEAFTGRGMAYYALGEYARAIDDFSAAIRLKPDGHEPYIYRGKAYRAMRGMDRAIADFTTAARVNPRSGWGHYERASTYWMTSPNMPATTLKDIDEAIRREPDNPNYYNFRGVVLTATDNFRRAIVDFDRAIALKPTMAIAYGNRGLAKYFLNRTGAEDISYCLVLDPSLQRWLEQQVTMIPAVQRQQAEFIQWYREIQRDAARTHDEFCRAKNCRLTGCTGRC
jgi:tetratricopeptide (TPR) repeat protein